MIQVFYSDDSERFKFYIFLCATDVCGQLGNSVGHFQQALMERDLGQLEKNKFLSEQLKDGSLAMGGRLTKLKDDIYKYFDSVKKTQNGGCLKLLTLR